MVFVVLTCSFFVFHLFIFLVHVRDIVCERLYVCVFICSQARIYYASTYNPKKYENFSFARREFILSAGYISCVHVSLYYCIMHSYPPPFFHFSYDAHTHPVSLTYIIVMVLHTNTRYIYLSRLNADHRARGT